MTLENKKNFCMQAFVVMILLFSLGVSAVHSNTIPTSIISKDVETTFYNGDTPAMTLTVTLPEVKSMLLLNYLMKVLPQSLVNPGFRHFVDLLKSRRMPTLNSSLSR